MRRDVLGEHLLLETEAAVAAVAGKAGEAAVAAVVDNAGEAAAAAVLEEASEANAEVDDWSATRSSSSFLASASMMLCRTGTQAELSVA